MSDKEWQEAEAEFEDYFKAKGKICYIYRFTDTKEVQKGRVRKTFTEARPADYLITDDGKTYYAEVKYTESHDKFSFGAIRDAQWIAARKTVAAGGSYQFFIKNGAGIWYSISAKTIFQHMEKSKTLHFKDYEYLIWQNIQQKKV